MPRSTAMFITTDRRVRVGQLRVGAATTTTRVTSRVTSWVMTGRASG
ncbi:MAG: hypothetical protein H5T69_04085 [Chloroflexi bacterium]|nr:hypothetical protein [Chloroflexota bacterium]